MGFYYDENIIKTVLKNKESHKPIYTFPGQFELMAMHVPKGKGVANEKHDLSTQTLSVVAGNGDVVLNKGTKNEAVVELKPNSFVVIEPGTFHEIRNPNADLKILTMYNPPVHAPATGWQGAIAIWSELEVYELSKAPIEHNGKTGRYFLMPTANNATTLYIHDNKHGAAACRAHTFSGAGDYSRCAARRAGKGTHVCPKCAGQRE